MLVAIRCRVFRCLMLRNQTNLHWPPSPSQRHCIGFWLQEAHGLGISGLYAQVACPTDLEWPEENRSVGNWQRLGAV